MTFFSQITAVCQSINVFFNIIPLGYDIYLQFSMCHWCDFGSVTFLGKIGMSAEKGFRGIRISLDDKNGSKNCNSGRTSFIYAQ